MDGATVALAPDRRRLYPVGTVHGRILLKKIFVVHTFRIALHGERPTRQMGQQHGRYANVEINHLSFCETGGGVEDLFKICELELAALHFDDGGSGHEWSMVVRRWSFAVRRLSHVASACNEKHMPNDKRPTTDPLYCFAASSSIVSRFGKEIKCRLHVASLFMVRVPSERWAFFLLTFSLWIVPNPSSSFTTASSGP